MVSAGVDTFLTTLRAMVTVVMVYLAGFLLVKLRVINASGVKSMATLSNFLFVPALFLTTLGGSLNLETLKKAWALPVLGIILMLFNFIVAKYIIVPLAKPTASFRKFFILGQTTTNITALPLVLVSSLCSQKNFKKPDYMLDGNNNNDYFTQNECVDQGNVYLFLYGLLITIFTWTFGYEFVEQGEDSVIGVVITEEIEMLEKGEAKKFNVPEEIVVVQQINNDDPEEYLIVDGVAGKPDLEGVDQQDISSGSASASVSTANNHHPIKVHDLEHHHPRAEYWKAFGKRFGWNLLKPVNSTQFIGITIGLIEPVQKVLFDSGAPLQPFTAGVEVISSGAMSIINIIMACTLSLKLLSIENKYHIFGHEEIIGISRRTLMTYALSRMVLLPAISMGVLVLIEEFWFHIVPHDDQLMRLIVYLELITPSANMVVIMAQIIGHRNNAELLAMGGLVQYFIGIFTMSAFTFVIVLYLGIV